MASVTHATQLNVTTNATSYASPSFTPVAGDLLVVQALMTGTTNDAPTLTASANGMTFSLVTVAQKGAGADRLYLFVSNQLVPSNPVAMTVTLGGLSANATGCIMFVSRVSGMERVGTTAVRQYKVVSNNAASTPSIIFTSACLTGNVTFGLIGNATSPATMTAPTGWTEPTNGDLGYATPTTGGEYVFRNSGFTGTTVTWGNASASAWGGIISELDTLPLPPNAPSTVAPAVIGSVAFTAKWQAGAGGNAPTSYRLDVDTRSDFGGAATGGNVLSDVDTGLVTKHYVSGLTANTTYYYRVRATGVGGASANSDTRSVTTQTAWHPHDVPGLLSWHAAPALTLNDGDSVQTWADLADNGHTFSQSSVGARPTFDTNAQNGQAGVSFDGSDDFMDTPTSPAIGAVFVVTRLHTELTTYQGLFTSQTDAGGVFFTTDGGNSAWWTGNTPIQNFFMDGVAGNVMDRSPGATRLYEGTRTSTTLALGSNWRIGVDRVHGNLGRWWPGHIFEIITYSQVLTQAQREAVEDYLIAKYAVGMATRTQAYTVRVAAKLVGTQTYTVRVAAKATYTSAYTARVAAKLVATQVYAVRVAARATYTAAYAVRAASLLTATAPYAVRVAPKLVVTAGYVVRVAAKAVVTDVYTVRVATKLVGTQTYAVRVAAFKIEAAPYAVRVASFKTATAPYTVRVATSAGATAPYTVRVAARATYTTVYQARVAARLVASAAHAVRVASVLIAATPYAVRVAAYATYVAPYAIRVAPKLVATQVYAVRVAARATYTAAYAVRVASMQVGAGIAQYDVRVAALATLSTTYSVRVAGALVGTAPYTVRVAVLLTRPETYTVRVAAYRVGTAAYTVRVASASVATSSYTVRVASIITPVAGYPVRVAVVGYGLQVGYSVRVAAKSRVGVGYIQSGVRTATDVSIGPRSAGGLVVGARGPGVGVGIGGDD